MNATILKKIYEPIGAGVHTFMVDYRDSCNNFCNGESVLVMPLGMDYNNDTVAQIIISDYKTKDFTVYAIHEILNGFTNNELIVMAQRNPNEVLKNLRWVYYDAKKEYPLS